MITKKERVTKKLLVKENNINTGKSRNKRRRNTGTDISVFTHIFHLPPKYFDVV